MEPITSGNFTFAPTDIDGVILVSCKSYGDERGAFMETYKRPDFVAGGIDADFVQDNQSTSVKGVLRGLHFQIRHPQAKLVRVVEGKVFDVAVDLRPNSATFGRWTGVVLSAGDNRQFFIPRGFAHGFYVMSDHATFAYKCDDTYHPHDEGGICWDDPTIAINWPLDPSCELILSEKDQRHESFAQWCQERGLKPAPAPTPTPAATPAQEA